MAGHRYTESERVFFQEYIPGHTYKEIQAEFIKRFGWDIKISQIKGYMANHRINNGLTGRFEKGYVPSNKGNKGFCAPGSEKGWFQKDHIPQNHRPVGSERMSKDGYAEVKVSEPNKWQGKHRIAWEEHHGSIPKGHIIIFLDGDPLNCSIKNLACIDRNTNARLNQRGLRFQDAESTKAAIGVAQLINEIAKAEKRRKGKRDGKDSNNK